MEKTRMPFHREWEDGKYIFNRNRTGPLPPPETGRTAQEDGFVVVANQNVQPDVPPATPVEVNFPGPNEPIVGANGLITPRWWRFLDELYRRTGGPVDNINKAPNAWLPPDTVALVLSGAAPVVNVAEISIPSTQSVALTGYAPTVS
jgi:hypothetical protein